MKSKSSQKEESLSFELWRQIIQKLEEKGKTIEWLAEQLPVEKKTFYWFYYRRIMQMHMLVYISEVLQHNYIKFCSDCVQKELEANQKK